MAKPKKQESAPTTASEEATPVIESLSFRRVDGGWACFVLKTQGDRVLSCDRVGEPNVFAIARDTFKVEAARRFLRQA